MFCAFEVRPKVTNILVTRYNILQWKSIYLQKSQSSILSTMLRYFVTAPIAVFTLIKFQAKDLQLS